jgi:hypothetical protein
MTNEDIAQEILAIHEQLNEKYARVGDGIYECCPILWKLHNLAWDVENSENNEPA